MLAENMGGTLLTLPHCLACRTPPPYDPALLHFPKRCRFFERGCHATSVLRPRGFTPPRRFAGAVLRACCSSMPDLGFATLPAATTSWVPKHTLGRRGLTRDAHTLRRFAPRRQPDRVTTTSLPSCRSSETPPRWVPLHSASPPRWGWAAVVRTRSFSRTSRSPHATWPEPVTPCPHISVRSAVERPTPTCGPPPSIVSARVAPCRHCRMVPLQGLSTPAHRGERCPVEEPRRRRDRSSDLSYTSSVGDRAVHRPTSGVAPPTSPSASPPLPATCCSFLPWAWFPFEASPHRPLDTRPLGRIRSRCPLAPEPGPKAGHDDRQRLSGDAAPAPRCRGQVPPWGFRRQRTTDDLESLVLPKKRPKPLDRKSVV